MHYQITKLGCGAKKLQDSVAKQCNYIDDEISGVTRNSCQWGQEIFNIEIS